MQVCTQAICAGGIRDSSSVDDGAVVLVCHQNKATAVFATARLAWVRQHSRVPTLRKHHQQRGCVDSRSSVGVHGFFTGRDEIACSRRPSWSRTALRAMRAWCSLMTLPFSLLFTCHRCECLWQVLSLSETDDASHRPARMHR